MKKIFVLLKTNSSGQALFLAIVFLLLGTLLVIPLLTLVATGASTGEVYGQKTLERYTADAGVQDGLWQIATDRIKTFTSPQVYSPYNYTSEWPSPNYTLANNLTSGEVTIKNVWIPKNIQPPDTATAQNIINSMNLIVSGSTKEVGVLADDGTTKISQYEISIVYPAALPTLKIETIGVWLPRGFEYFPLAHDSDTHHKSSLEVTGKPYNTTPVESDWAGNKAYLWTFSSVPFTSFDTVDPVTLKVTFYYHSLTGNSADKPMAVSWVTTSGDAQIPFAWDADVHVFKLNSLAGNTRVEAYTAKVAGRSLPGTISGDYYATGGSLLIDTNGDEARDTVPPGASQSTVDGSNIPDDADVSAAYLYWSAWKDDSISTAISPLNPDNCNNITSYWNRSGTNAYNNTAWGNTNGRYVAHAAPNPAPGPTDYRYLTLKNGMNLSSYSAGRVTISWDQFVSALAPIFTDTCNTITTNWDRSGSNAYNTTAWSGNGSYFSGHYAPSPSPGPAGYSNLTLKNGTVNMSSYAGSTVKVSWDQSVTLPAAAPIAPLNPDNCNSFTSWNNGSSWTATGTFNGHYNGSGDSSRLLTLKNSLDLSSYSGGATLSWDQGASGTAQIQAFSDSCTSSNLTNYYSNGGDWSYDSTNRRYRARHSSTSLPASYRYLTLNSLNLSGYGSTGSITVSWDQAESGNQGPSDGLDFAYSLDGGNNWSANIQAFRDDNPSTPFSYTINNVTLPNNFRLRFYLQGFNNTTNYCYIDNISVNVTPAHSETDALEYAFSGDGGTTWSENFQAFSGTNPPGSFSTAIPSLYLTPTFKVRVNLAGFSGYGESCTLDNIRVSGVMSLSGSDGLDFAFSGDGGSTWSANLTAFRGNIGTSFTNFAYTIPAQYLTSTFRMRFSLAGFATTGAYCNIDNISFTPSYSDNDGLDFALSRDGGTTWSSNIQAFRGDIGSTALTYRYLLPSLYVTNNFKMRFYVVGCNGTGMYVNIDDIQAAAMTAMTADPTVVFKINNQQVYLDGGGVPRQGNVVLTATQTQTLPNYAGTSPPQPHGYSYTGFCDVTALVRAFTPKAPDPATNYSGHATYAVSNVDCDIRDQWSYAGWSLILIYTSPSTQGHQLYLFDRFTYSSQDTQNGVDVDFDYDGQPGGTISGFIVPQPVAGEVNAAKITCFVGEGDECYSGDFLAFNAPENYKTHPKDIPDSYKLWDGTVSTTPSASDDPSNPSRQPNNATQPNNVWNSKSVGLNAQGIDVDTFYVPWSSGMINPGDTKARIDLFTRTDVWNLIYIILSFRSETTTGGPLGYLITGP